MVAEHDAKALRLRLLEELRAAVGFDAYVWLLTDPTTAVGAAPVADVPCLHELPTLIKAKYLTEVNRWTGHGGGPAARSLQMTTGGEPARSLLWRAVLCRYQVADVLSVVFRDAHGWWGFLDLWRRDGAFQPPEVEHLSRLAPSITDALRRCQAATFAETPVPQRADTGPAVLVLDDELTVVGETTAAAHWLERLVPPTGGAPTVPAAVYNVAGQLLALEQGVDGHPASARVHLADGFWVTLRAARLAARPGSGAPPIAVTLEETPPLDRLDVFVRGFALTPREGELLRLLAAGADTRDAARRLFLSEHTVQDHLKSIFARTGARTRRSLLSRAMGSSPEQEKAHGRET